MANPMGGSQVGNEGLCGKARHGGPASDSGVSITNDTHEARWKEFWEATAKSKDPISAVDLPQVSRRTYQAMCQRVRELLELSPDDIMLNIGCGTGLFEERFAHTVKRMTGIDLAWAMTSEARRRSIAFQNVFFAQGSAVALPFKDRQFSKVLCYGVLMYLADDQVARLLDEVRRVAKPGALILIGEIDEGTREGPAVNIRKAVEVYEASGLHGVAQKAIGVIVRRTLRVVRRFRARWLWLLGRYVLAPKPMALIRHPRGEVLALAASKGLDAWVIEQREERFFAERYSLLVKR
jgi:ubiquinone/menaquinone biosynthesis C-methylase UbiE